MLRNRLYNFIILLPFLCISHTFAKEPQSKFLLKLGSVVHHIQIEDNVDYNEGFDNQLIMAGMKLNNDYEIVGGTLINSYGDRCAILGIGKNWYDYNSKISIEGLYAYVGEFFLHQFNNCKDSGIYKNFYDQTNLGFAPYLYHGIKYKFHPVASFEFGLIFPSVLVGTIRWEF